jgi:hypothetical protein
LPRQFPRNHRREPGTSSRVHGGERRGLV